MTELRNISDTALWVATYRARESERPDALFRDPFARRLAGERGERILDAMPHARRFAWPMVVRTAVMDEVVMRLVGRGARSVLNLAAGLDTRAYRLPLPASLRWLDVDLPGVVAYRAQHLAGEKAACRHEEVEADLQDPAARAEVVARLASEDAPALVITEGLLVYLERDEVAGVARGLHANPALRWWLMDLASPALLRMLARSWQPRLAAANAPMKFAPAEGTAFFAPHGWREEEFHSTWEDSLRLGRSVPFARLWDLLGRLRPRAAREAARRISAVVLLERT